MVKNSFTMKLLCLVEAEGCVGYIADVRRELDLAFACIVVNVGTQACELTNLYVAPSHLGSYPGIG